MRQEFKASIKILAFVLSFFMLIVSLPMYAYASLIDTQSTENSEVTEPQGEVVVLEEDESLREKNIKHFKLSDGTSKAVVYQGAVHYLDENGNWVDIDNALTLNGNDYLSSNKSEIKFANKSGSNGLVSIKDGDYKIDFTPLDANKSSVIIENPQKKSSRKFEDVSRLNSLISKAIYANIYDGVDIEYILVGNNIKENIIVKEKQDSYAFSFELELSKLSAELVNGAIILSDYDSGEKIYEIPVPYMYDANNAYSQSVEYSLVQNGKWKYTLTVAASPEWISTAKFPVTIDPTVVVEDDAIIDIYAFDNGTIDPKSDKLFVGSTSSMPNARSYIKPTAIPQLGYYNMVITDAKLSLYARELSGASSLKIGAYQINSSWSETSVPSQISSAPLDYQEVNETGTFYTWNITELVRSWDEGVSEMHGICLQSIDTVTNSYVAFESSEPSQQDLMPVIEYSYVNASGIQPHMSYYSFSAGSSGTGYVNSFNGELVFAHNVFTTADEIMPYTFSIYMDGRSMAIGMCHNEFIYPFTDSENITRYCWERADGSIIWFSPIVERNPNGTYEFYEYSESGLKVATSYITKYYDESGLGLCLTIDENGQQIISDDTGNQRCFAGNLKWIKDSYGNTRYFTFENSNTIISLKPNGVENPIPQIKIGDISGNLCIQNLQTGVIAQMVHQEDGRFVGMIYKYPSLEQGSSETEQYTVSFEYGENGSYFIAKDDVAQKGVKYSFENGKVSYIQELAYNGSQVVYGQSAYITYNYMSTEYRTLGADNLYGTADDLITIYNYDYIGRVITAYSCDGNRNNVYGATNYAYNDKYKSEDVGAKKHNSIKTSLNSGANAVNLLKNPTFESGVGNWTGIGGSIFSALPNASELEISYGKALQLARTSAGTTKAQQTLTLQKGSYNLSLSSTRKNVSQGSIFRMKVYDNETGALVAMSVPLEKYPVTDNILNMSWEKESLDFEIDKAGEYTVSLEYQTTSSSYSAIYLDDVMLEKHSGMGAFSAYENGSFESSLDGEALNAFKDSDEKLLGENSLRLTPGISSESYYKYTYDVHAGIETEKLIVSAWVKAPDAVSSTNSYMHSARLGMEIVVHYSGTTDISSFFIPIDASNGNWQYVVHSLTIPTVDDAIENLVSGGTITSIDVYCIYEKNVGSAYFDSISINREGDSVSYEYNGLGNITSAKSTNGTSTEYTYSQDNATDVTGATDSSGNNYSFEYDENHHLTGASYNGHGGLTQGKINSSYEYNDQGQIIAINAVSSSLHLNTVTAYNTDGAKAYYSKVKETYDELGNKTMYFYYENGLLKGIVDPTLRGVKYVYNSYGELIGAIPVTYDSASQSLKDASPYSSDSYYDIDYEYNSKHELEKISTNSTLYTFAYDEWGNTVSIKAGNNTLATYQYEQGNGNLITLAYGNGASVSYVYDNLDRVVGICYNGIKEVAYVYSSSGAISSVKDIVNNTTYQYYYDAEGRLINERAIDNLNASTSYNTFYEYDDNGRVTGMSIYFPSSERDPVTAITYTYNDDGTIKKIHNGITVSSENYTYDSFGRLSSNGLKVGSSTILSDTYQYQTQGAGDAGVVITSNRVSQVTTTLPNATNEITYYTYDGAGNITCIRYYYPSNGTNKYVYYHYDNVGQLEREDNQLLGYTYLYSYDDSGNMVYKETRNYTTAPTNEVWSTQPLTWESFGRDNLYWADRRTYYSVGQNSGTTTYDEIGNPINYYNGSSYTFSWENGRRLAGVVDGSSTYTYKYNQDGIRVKKEVWGTGYEYILNGTQIMVEREYVIGSNRTVAERRYFYDANGIISSAKVYYYGYNGTTCTEFDFFFKTNIQGDVLAVYNASGTEVMKITYDAWGNFTDTVSTMSYPPSTEQLQAYAIPFRYRGYVYDQETGFYYLNSRYYDPAMHRFINADGLVSTGQGLLGNNMYAYCNNNPVMYVDPNGNLSFSILGAIDMLKHFFFGHGEDKVYTQNSNISNSLNDSAKMDEKIGEAISKYRNTGDNISDGSIGFGKEDGLDLWLSLRNCEYVITVSQGRIRDSKCRTLQEKMRGRVVYIVHVKITDTYDFNGGQDVNDGIGSVLNNIGYWFEKNGWGETYDTTIEYSKIIDPYYL